jgi:hypothetical protein
VAAGAVQRLIAAGDLAGDLRALERGDDGACELAGVVGVEAAVAEPAGDEFLPVLDGYAEHSASSLIAILRQAEGQGPNRKEQGPWR